MPPEPHLKAEDLCSRCGLCCNGVLFADVELKKDDPKRLAKSGLSLMHKGRGLAFAQPCACFDGTLCRIYEERPAHCRAFECGVLQRTQVGRLSTAAALSLIERARSKAEAVRVLVRSSGNRDEHLPLSSRYAAVLSQPIDLQAGIAVQRRRSKLAVAMEELMTLLQRDFLS